MIFSFYLLEKTIKITNKNQQRRWFFLFFKLVTPIALASLEEAKLIKHNYSIFLQICDVISLLMGFC